MEVRGGAGDTNGCVERRGERREGERGIKQKKKKRRGRGKKRKRRLFC